MFKNIFTGTTEYASFEDFLEDYFLNRGQVISFKNSCQLHPPTCWSDEKRDNEMDLWGRQIPHKLCRDGSYLNWVQFRSIRIIDVVENSVLSAEQIHAMVKDGELGGIKIGKSWWIYRKFVQKYFIV
jgi:hypothetical protein